MRKKWYLSQKKCFADKSKPNLNAGDNNNNNKK
jgi:hypothetical protein